MEKRCKRELTKKDFAIEDGKKTQDDVRVCLCVGEIAIYTAVLLKTSYLRWK